LEDRGPVLGVMFNWHKGEGRIIKKKGATTAKKEREGRER